MIYRPQFFQLYELVCPDVYDKYGQMAWQFLDDKALITMDWIRRTLDKKISINTWHDGGNHTQSGLRCNQCQLVKDKTTAGTVYLSAHILGRAYDFSVDGMDAGEVRVWIALNKDKLPYNIRLEKDVNWVHLDSYDTGLKIFFFNP